MNCIGIIMFAFILIVAHSDKQYLQFSEQSAKINGIAVHTMVFFRNNQKGFFTKFIDYYTKLQCDILTQINVVWYSQISFQQLNLSSQQLSWKRPIRYIKNPKKSVNYRFLIPQQSESKVFLFVDQDILMPCQLISNGFKKYVDNMIEQVGPIVSFAPYTYHYTTDQGFSVISQPQQGSNFMTITSIQAAIISRHLCELYYVEESHLNALRDLVIDQRGCEDIGFNFMVAYYYPQIRPLVIISRNLSIFLKQRDIFNQKGLKSNCITGIAKIFGQVSLRLNLISQNHSNQVSMPLQRLTLMAKYQYFQRKIDKFKNQENDQFFHLRTLFDKKQIFILQRKDMIVFLKYLILALFLILNIVWYKIYVVVTKSHKQNKKIKDLQQNVRLSQSQ